MIAEENAAKPPLPWPLREAGKGFHRLPDRIRGFLLNAGPGFADLLDRFEKLEFTKPGTHTEFRLTDDGSEEAEEFVFDEIQVPALRQAVQLLITAGKRVKTQQPAQPRQAVKLAPARPKADGGRGPTPRDHAEIVAIVEQHRPWKDNLEDVCKALDNAGVPIPERWKKWRDRARTWTEALMSTDAGAQHSDGESNVIKSIEHSLKQAKSSGK